MDAAYACLRPLGLDSLDIDELWKTAARRFKQRILDSDRLAALEFVHASWLSSNAEWGLQIWLPTLYTFRTFATQLSL